MLSFLLFPFECYIVAYFLLSEMSYRAGKGSPRSGEDSC